MTPLRPCARRRRCLALARQRVLSLLMAWALMIAGATAARAEDRPLAFGVLSQRSPTLTAEYWNPILTHLSARTGLALELRIGRSAPETVTMASRGDFDFIYSNNLFAPDKQALGFRVIARPATEAIHGQIVVLDGSPVRTLAELAGREMLFPSPVAFVGYQVTGDALVKAGITVKPLFAGNQEGAMAQLKAGQAEAAAVNSAVMADFARREGLSYRVLWSSPPFLDIPIMAGPTVSDAVAGALRDALAGMAGDPEGQEVLNRAARAGGIKPVSYVTATDADYQSYLTFYRNARLDLLPK
ncbi:MAG: phosphate/phosphite/phosphonate ABC transporter substrate-binding protein [Rhodospirillaceae bacterium]